MSTLDFDCEFYSETPDPGGKLKMEAEHRLRRLAQEHSDFIGASVVILPVTRKRSEKPLLYEARIVAYIRPAKLAITEQARTMEAALKRVLDSMERQIREQRDKQHARWKQPVHF